MTAFARGVSKTVAIALETTPGVQATTTAQLLRRVTSDLNLNVNAIDSTEIQPSQQMRDSRQGTRSVSGTLTGQLSPASYKMIFQQLLRGTFTAGAALTGLTDVAVSIDAPTGNVLINGPAESFLTAGFKKGDVIRLSGLTGGPASDNGQNLRIVALSQNQLNCAPPPGTFTTFSSGQTDSITVVGKKLITPVTGQSDQSFTIEHWYADTGTSELFLGCKFTQVAFNVQASGFIQFTAQITGLQQITSGVQVYPSATAPSTTTSLTATGGKVIYQGTPTAVITGFNMQIVSAADAPTVVGSNVSPNIFMGMLQARGSFTALMINDTITADFLNEAEVDLSLLMTTGPTPGADFISLYAPRAKIMSSSKTDSDRAITRSYNYTLLEQINGGPGTVWDDTTLVMQDSLA
jgi:hypothetical protein